MMKDLGLIIKFWTLIWINKMTQEAFKEILKEKGIKFTQEGETIVVSKDNISVWLNSLTALPRDAPRFENNDWVLLDSLQTLPEGMRFENNGGVSLDALQTIPEGTMFENNGSVWLNSKATRFNPTFRNKGDINLVSFHNKTKGIPTAQDEHGTKIMFEQ